jgi:hypothetical protein
MVRLHNSGKSLCGMPSHPQCACWFSHWHHMGSGEELSLASLELLQGVVLRLFGIARSSRLGYRWYVANVLIYAYDRKSSAFRQRLPWLRLLFGCAPDTTAVAVLLCARYNCGAVMAWSAWGIDSFCCVIYPRKAPPIKFNLFDARFSYGIVENQWKAVSLLLFKPVSPNFSISTTLTCPALSPRKPWTVLDIELQLQNRQRRICRLRPSRTRRIQRLPPSSDRNPQLQNMPRYPSPSRCLGLLCCKVKGVQILLHCWRR